MDIKPLLQQKLTVELKLTPALMHSMELLQLPIIELENALKDEIETNPVIEIEEQEEDSVVSVDKEGSESVWDFVVDGGNLVFIDDSETFDPLSIKPSPVSLRDRLLKQASLEFDGKDFEIAKFIIDNLDTTGFLKIPFSEIASEFGVSTEQVESVRKKILRFDPVGCAAKDIIECFKVQAEEIGAPEKFVKAIEYIDELRKGSSFFVKKTGFSEKELEEFLSLLRHLDPQPGSDTETVRIVPDLFVGLRDGKPEVKVLKTKMFNFRLNTAYLKTADTKELKKYLMEKYQRALNLKKAIDQRNQTLKSIGEVVFSHQIEFLKKGEKYIKPLGYKDVAEKLSIHESTVSRAVKDKFVETPFGVYPFKVFFKRAVSGTSSDRIKELIKEIIESEDKRKPFSDLKISQILKEKGVKVARRTVAKYREEMGIPGAFERRER
ncbi:RNA polymerase factor sigma-54 [Desulfurobacterium atlanticum]|uniref:RNA polymerase, sigma 54 subunit, RpoN/SigL n=1 Tax=Desulfurobacterium atlanticum TaxID=240169 RepID=A0A238XSS8_9BACT|nr:RNA polymerase factor sigma-54 [Desulfurobacterium atlanticum]SNR61762.1 RNA polymerase, sigma 54 subunit, RpoN/SigL [Desulfurobacterium atlanticum]